MSAQASEQPGKRESTTKSDYNKERDGEGETERPETIIPLEPLN